MNYPDKYSKQWFSLRKHVDHSIKPTHDALLSQQDRQLSHELQQLSSAADYLEDNIPEPPSDLPDKIMQQLLLQSAIKPWHFPAKWRYLGTALGGTAAIAIIVILIAPWGELSPPVNPSNITTYPQAYNDMRIASGPNKLMTYLEGSLGAILFVVFIGLSALSAILRRYLLAMILLLLTILMFFLRSILATPFS